MKLPTLEEFISAYTPSLDGKNVISFVSLRASTKWQGESKVIFTLTMRDDLYTNTILTFEEECLLDTIFVFQQWLDAELAKSDEEMYSALDEANFEIEVDFNRSIR